jgi:hypothetical protein
LSSYAWNESKNIKTALATAFEALHSLGYTTNTAALDVVNYQIKKFIDELIHTPIVIGNCKMNPILIQCDPNTIAWLTILSAM